MFRQIKGNGTLYRVEKNGVVIDLTAGELEQLVREIYSFEKDLVDEQGDCNGRTLKTVNW